MKIALGLLLVVVVGLLVVFKFGGVSGFSPAEQAKQLQTDVQPGMAWTEVADKFPPKKMSVVVPDHRGIPIDSQPMKFDRAAVEKAAANGGYQQGFSFIYIFDASNQFSVRFSGEFKVVAVQKMITMDDLLNPK